MQVLIDPHAGFCPGVHRAIKLIEQRLDKSNLIAFGPVIHNRRELGRLAENGLKTLLQEDVEQEQILAELQGKELLVRTHGIGPHMRHRLMRANIVLADATCSIVQRVQKIIAEFYRQGYQIIIIGKRNHAEVIGFLGYCQDQAIIIENEADIVDINPQLRTAVVAQTTIGQEKFHRLIALIKQRVDGVEVVDTTCRFIRRRQKEILGFANSVDVLIFVGGKESSNSQVLFEKCHEVNPRSHTIESPDELKRDWFKAEDVIGITGGASTPLWQLEEVRESLKTLKR